MTFASSLQDCILDCVDRFAVVAHTRFANRREFGRADPEAFIFGVVLSLTAWWLSAVRLWILEPRLSLRAVVRISLIAIYYGTVLPGQVAGDAVKAYRLTSVGLTLDRAAAATLVDRALATLALLFLGTCAAPWVDRAPRELGILLSATTAVIAIGMLSFAHGRLYASLTNWMRSTKPPRVLAFAGRTMDGFHLYLQKPYRLAACFVIALIFHGLCLAIHVVVGSALGIQLATSVWVLVYGAVALLMLLPISVAGLGLREGGTLDSWGYLAWLRQLHSLCRSYSSPSLSSVRFSVGSPR